MTYKPIEGILDILIDATWMNKTDKPPTTDQEILARHVAHQWLHTMIGDENTVGICIESLGSFFESRLKARYQDLAQTLQSVKTNQSPPSFPGLISNHSASYASPILSAQNVENLAYIN